MREHNRSQRFVGFGKVPQTLSSKAVSSIWKWRCLDAATGRTTARHRIATEAGTFPWSWMFNVSKETSRRASSSVISSDVQILRKIYVLMAEYSSRKKWQELKERFLSLSLCFFDYFSFSFLSSLFHIFRLR